MVWRAKHEELHFKHTDENHRSRGMLVTVAHGALRGGLSPQGSTPVTLALHGKESLLLESLKNS